VADQPSNVVGHAHVVGARHLDHRYAPRPFVGMEPWSVGDARGVEWYQPDAEKVDRRRHTEMLYRHEACVLLRRDRVVAHKSRDVVGLSITDDLQHEGPEPLVGIGDPLEAEVPREGRLEGLEGGGLVGAQAEELFPGEASSGGSGWQRFDF
jgi:hypothetical protein